MPFDLTQLPRAHVCAHAHTPGLKHCVGIKGSSAGWFMVSLTRFNTWAIHLLSLIFPLGYMKGKCDIWLDAALSSAASRTERDNMLFFQCRMNFLSLWHFVIIILFFLAPYSFAFSPSKLLIKFVLMDKGLLPLYIFLKDTSKKRQFNNNKMNVMVWQINPSWVKDQLN